jgi:hypothetical protein
MMGRGLSQQQRQILGLAYSVNQMTGGKIKTGDIPDWNPRVRLHDGISDMKWQLAAHVLKGIPFKQHYVSEKDSWYVNCPTIFDNKDKRLKAAKASVVRAISSLYKSGYLVALAPKDRNRFVWGYGLTAPGMEVGKLHPVTVEDWQIVNAGLVISDHCNEYANHIREGKIIFGCFCKHPPRFFGHNLPITSQRYREITGMSIEEYCSITVTN